MASRFFGLLFLSACLCWGALAQTIPAGFPVLEEAARRRNLLDVDYKNSSFALRPVRMSAFPALDMAGGVDSVSGKRKHAEFRFLPLLNTTVYNSNRPYGWGNSAMLNGAGWQNLFSPGIFARLFFLEIQLRPEWVRSENKSFRGFMGGFSDRINFARFRYWNFGDNPEYFGDGYSNFLTPGQSYVSLHLAKIEAGVGTQNIWWGPGQFTSLIFSNNARGMPHAFLRTSAPVNIGIGHLEGEIIAGRAEDSGLDPTQNEALNRRYFRAPSGDWRYVTGFSFTYQPAFMKNLFVGVNRTFQQYERNVENSFKGRLPIFEAFQKKKFFENGHSVGYDGEQQDQQVSVFFRLKAPKAKAELYAEYGKHDHSYNWREFILNPEHARAYMFGFTKLVALPGKDQYLQFRGEVIQQSESINRYVRYTELGILNTSWHTHYQVRGFTNYGEAMGTGIGVGSDAQILEVAKVTSHQKIGVLLQRIVNHKDFYYLAATERPDTKPWIDYSMGLLWDRQWGGFVLSAVVQSIYGTNYQWRGGATSSVDFPSGNNIFSFSSQINLVYTFNQ
ncbi:hypothetical protein J0A68_18185 [Algoriphagus sp. H41]|uniref:Capsule assembly protein Wzi n=1 Tax=Algoriphagus oliviformis TaxID=2811231 RepID=A0ABS3C8K6_9BACT|nr:capsule assembly Wzi family protein [Algoriphagus oliviformis]MBN7812891.1 hypothetical protein [Algoriphagus oliviformis]